MASRHAAENAFRTTKNIAARSVHVHLRPTPMTLHDRRGILRVMKQFGEVIMFRPLKDDPDTPAQNSILAMYETAEAAQKLIAEAPLEFEVEPLRKAPRNSSLETLDILQPGSRGDVEPDSESCDNSPRHFYLEADPSRADHLGRMQRQKYYWGFNISKKEFAQEDLAFNVPVEAYSDMQATPTPVPQRVVEKKLKDVAAKKSLQELWALGQDERERRKSGNVYVE